MNGELKRLIAEMREDAKEFDNWGPYYWADRLEGILDQVADTPTPAPGALPELPAIPESLMATLQDAMNQYTHTGGCDIDAVIAAISAYAEQCRAGVWLPASTAPDGDCLEFPIWVAWNNGRVDYVDECACVDYAGCIGWMKVIPPAPPALQAAYAEQCRAGVWLPIESAPKDGSHVIAWFGNSKHGGYAESVYFSGEHWHWTHDGDSPNVPPTHWMPLHLLLPPSNPPSPTMRGGSED